MNNVKCAATPMTYLNWPSLSSCLCLCLLAVSLPSASTTFCSISRFSGTLSVDLCKCEFFGFLLWVESRWLCYIIRAHLPRFLHWVGLAAVDRRTVCACSLRAVGRGRLYPVFLVLSRRIGVH